MRACVFVHPTNALANANNFVAAINAVLGLPRDGVDAFGSVREGKGVTTTWCSPIQKPSDPTQYAVPIRARLLLLATAAAENWIVNGINDPTKPWLSRVVPFSLTTTQYATFKTRLLNNDLLTADWFMPAGEPGD